MGPYGISDTDDHNNIDHGDLSSILCSPNNMRLGWALVYMGLKRIRREESFYSALGKLLGEQLAIATQITSESIARTALSWVPGTPLTEEHVLGACTETIDGVVIFLGLCTCRPHHEGSVLLGWEDDLPHMKIEHTPFY